MLHIKKNILIFIFIFATIIKLFLYKSLKHKLDLFIYRLNLIFMMFGILFLINNNYDCLQSLIHNWLGITLVLMFLFVKSKIYNIYGLCVLLVVLTTRIIFEDCIFYYKKNKKRNKMFLSYFEFIDLDVLLFIFILLYIVKIYNL